MELEVLNTQDLLEILKTKTKNMVKDGFTIHYRDYSTEEASIVVNYPRNRVTACWEALTENDKNPKFLISSIVINFTIDEKGLNDLLNQLDDLEIEYANIVSKILTISKLRTNINNIKGEN